MSFKLIENRFVAAIILTIVCAIAVEGQSELWEKNQSAGDKAFERNRLAEAAGFYQAALKDADKFHYSDMRLRLTLENLATIYDRLGNYADAEIFYLRLVKNSKKSLEVGLNSLNLGRNDRTVSGIESAPGSDGYDFAFLTYGHALEQLIKDLNHLIDVYKAQNKFLDAEKAYAQIASVLKDAVSRAKKSKEREAEMRESLAQSYDDWAMMYLKQGKFAEAEKPISLSLQARGDAPETVNPKIGEMLAEIALAYAHQNRYDKAEPLYQRALKIFEKAYGLDNIKLAGTLENYAALLNKTGRASEAAATMRRAEEIRQKN